MRHARVGAGVGNRSQRHTVAVQPLDVLELRVEPLGPLDHLAGHVEREHSAGAAGQRAGQPTQPAAHVDDGLAAARFRARSAFNRLSSACSPPDQKASSSGRAVLEAAVDEVVGVLARASVPEALHVGAAHRASVQWRGCGFCTWGTTSPHCGRAASRSTRMPSCRPRRRVAHHVSYVFSGRHYPLLNRPRLRRWRDRGVSMVELVCPPMHTHWETGTRRPDLDIAEPEGEAASTRPCARPGRTSSTSTSSRGCPTR